MHIITSHDNTDYDGLAAMVAIQKMHPEGVMVLPGRANRFVSRYLSLHRDVWDIKHSSFIECSQITRITVADTHTVSRLGRISKCILKSDIDVKVYDHHPISNTALTTESYNVGAITTVLVNILKEKDIAINSAEATLFALGIYSDTAFLTAETTTSLDAYMVAYLLDQGADLEIIQQFLYSPLSFHQRGLLEDLLLKGEQHKLNDANVLILSHTMDEYVDGLGSLVDRIMQLGYCDVAIAIVFMDDRIFITVRSNLERFNAALFCQRFGGGGHKGAASATIKSSSVEEVKSDVINIIPEYIKPEIRAKDVMSSPVRVVDSFTSIKEAYKIMLSSGHSGLPVLENDQLVGIISRRDVDKAEHHGLSHAPVKGFMSEHIVTSAPDSPISEIQRLIVSNNIGRVPIVENGNLLGIVTRTDILMILHGQNYPHWYKSNYRKDNVSPNRPTNLTRLLNHHLSDKLQAVLFLAGQAALRCDTVVYVVGGFVRDLLLEESTNDIDLVVEGDIKQYCQQLNQLLQGKLTFFASFGTARITLDAGISIDCAMARTEFYAGPGALPEVQRSTITHDLYRRDFTINTLAINLTGSTFGQLLDPFAGYADLNDGLIRILYNLSFVEDPTRILRAIRFEKRYNFKLESETKKFLDTALDNKVLSKVAPEKMLQELKLCFKERKAAEIILRMDELGILKTIFPSVNLTERQIKALRNYNQIISWINLDRLPEFKGWLGFLALLALERGKLHVHHIAERINLPSKWSLKLQTILDNVHFIKEHFDKYNSLKNSKVFSLLEGKDIEALLVAMSLTENKFTYDAILRYLFKLNNVDIEVNGKDLIDLGLSPGPVFGRLLKELREAKLDGIVNNRQEELQFIKQLLDGRKVL